MPFIASDGHVVRGLECSASGPWALPRRRNDAWAYGSGPGALEVHAQIKIETPGNYQVIVVIEPHQVQKLLTGVQPPAMTPAEED